MLQISLLMKRIIFSVNTILIFVYTDAFSSKIQISKLAKFATTQEAIKYLGVEDAYTKGFSIFDIQSKSQKIDGTFQDWINLSSSSLLSWNEAEQTKIKSQLHYIDSIIQANHFQFKLPDEIVFIKSTMIHEGDAEGYTRGKCIVLKDDITNLKNEQLRELLVHELFHVISRHDATLRRDLYKIIGFTICSEIELTSDLKKIIISNPDAPFHDSYISLKIGELTKDCMMILYADKPYSGGSFFSYLNIGLVELTNKETKEIDLNNGKPIIHEIDKVENFFEQVGFNTNYVIDPEEVMADNFVYAILNNTDKPSQKLLNDIRTRLSTK